MDYEKKYKEALARAKALNGTLAAGRDFLAEIFPELAESEDERIRKEIIDYLGLVGKGDGDYAQPMIDRWIAYLEKQKDKMTAEEYENSELFQLKLKTKYANGYQDGLAQKEQSITANDLDEEIHRFFDDCIDVHEAKLYGDISERVIPVDCYELTARHFAKWGKRQKEQKHPDGCFTCDEYKKGYEAGRLNGFTAGYNKAMKEVDQKEQEPAERSLEDDHIIGFVYDLLNEIEWKDSWAMSKDECLRLLSNYSPQKPAEWSEEDEIYLQDALWCVKRASKVARGENDMGACWSAERWLNSLKNRGNFPKSNTNSPSWSEEDEEMLNSCISSIEEAKENRYAYKETDGDTSYDHEIEWLKSLRPQPRWKPSEEQMNCLCAAVDAAIRKHNESVNGYKPARILKSLYEQLQKL